MWKVDVSAPTIRRQAETAGAAYVTVQTTAVDRLEEVLPPSPQGPDCQQMSVDGAMVPLVHKEWGEMRTLALGVVEPPVVKNGEVEVHTGQVSYFSRMCDAETFTRLATVETHRRGTETAKVVCAVVDGAPWEQDFIDMHRADAVRILDFAHAAAYVSNVGHVIYGDGTAAFSQWLTGELHELKQGKPETVIADLRRLGASVAESGAAGDETRATIDASVAYLDKRIDHMRYAEFVALGYPVGSGMVESGHTVVIETRLNGAGMHWTRTHANAMGALRSMLCSGRWKDEWPVICNHLRLSDRQGRRAARRQRQRAVTGARVQGDPAQAAGQATQPTPVPADHSPVQSVVRERGETGPIRPPANHPWRHSPVGRAHYRRSEQPAPPKT